MLNLDSNITVKELLDRCPAALPVFMALKMSCIGCPTEAYHSLAEVARIHGYSLEVLLADIGEAIERGQKP